MATTNKDSSQGIYHKEKAIRNILFKWVLLRWSRGIHRSKTYHS